MERPFHFENVNTPLRDRGYDESEISDKVQNNYTNLVETNIKDIYL